MSILTDTPWDAPLQACLNPRDSLYALLRIPMPETRMGYSADDQAMAKGGSGGGGPGGHGDGPDDYDSYGALARDAGY